MARLGNGNGDITKVCYLFAQVLQSYHPLVYIYVATHSKMIRYQLTSSSQHGTVVIVKTDSSFVPCTDF